MRAPVSRPNLAGGALLFALSVLLTIACGSAAQSTQAATPAGPMPGEARQAVYAVATEAAFDADDMEQAPEPAPPPQAPEAAAGTPARASAPSSAGAKDVAPSTVPKNVLLIYTADLTLAVYQVEEGLDRVHQLGLRQRGYLIARTDQSIVIRVPRDAFEATLAEIAKVGDVLHRNVRAEDVSDRYRDLEIRLKNARAVRDRLAELLVRATKVEEALKVEKELARVTEEIERLEGTLRDLNERIAYSTITVQFAARHSENVQNEVLRLPFPWLRKLGLSELLELR